MNDFFLTPIVARYLGPTLCLFSFVSGCASREVAKIEPGQAVVGKSEVAIQPNRNLDILFVIDNSGTMSDEQNSLAANFPLFIDKLSGVEGGLPNVHIGVISTDIGAGSGVGGECADPLGDNGSLQYQARPTGPIDNCQNPPAAKCEGLEDVFADGKGAYLRDVLNADGLTRSRNYTSNTDLDVDPDLSSRFSCVAQLGNCGCAIEQPLEAIRRALDPELAPETNTGFLREDAFLAVIIVSDEDDCSMADTNMFVNESWGGPNLPEASFLCFEHGVVCDPDDPQELGMKLKCRPRPGASTNAPNRSRYMNGVEEYADFLKGLKPNDPGQIIVAQITGGIDPVEVIKVDPDDLDIPEQIRLEKQCDSANIGKADPAIRLRSFAQQFPERNTSTTICQNDLSGALELIGNFLQDIVGSRCIEGNIDTNPTKPGVQEDCVVTELRAAGTDNEEEVVLPKCSSGAPDSTELPCWHLQENPIECPDSTTHLRLQDLRGTESVLAETKLRAQCVIVK